MHKIDMKNELFCALDVELTGFDPEQDSIIELGLYFFYLNQQGVVPVKEWSSVFRSSTQVKSRILGLTGITKQEMESAVEFSEKAEEVRMMLKDSRWVGHNLNMELKFLSKYGIVPESPPVDTLDLTQLILPTNPSYNLENLIHFFNIPVYSHHRALSDAKASASLLVSLLRIFQGFPDSLKKQIALLSQDFSFGFLFHLSLDPLVLENQDRSEDFSLLRKQVLSLAFSLNPAVLISSSQDFLMRSWRAGKLRLLSPRYKTFSPSKFTALLKDNLLPLEKRFALLKILVWQKTNWQTQTPEDLNLSFASQGAGGWVCGGESLNISYTDPVLGAFLKDFLNEDLPFSFSARNCVFTDLDRLEEGVSDTFGKSLSWQGLVRKIRDLCGETAVGIRLISAVDLFFGVVALVCKKYAFLGNQLDVNSLSSFDQNRLHNAAVRLVAVFESESNDFREKFFTTQELLRDFFLPNPDMAKWIAISDIRYQLISRPLKAHHPLLLDSSPKKLALFWGDDDILSYLLKRIGWTDVSVKNSSFSDFTSVKPAFFPIVNTKTWDPVEFLKNRLPCVMVFSTEDDARDFYETYGLDLRDTISVYMHRYFGGLSKITRNFGLRKNSLLLISPENLSASPIALQAKTLVFYRNQGHLAYKLDLYEKLAGFDCGLNEEACQMLSWKRSLMRAMTSIDGSFLEEIVCVGDESEKDLRFFEQLKAWVTLKYRIIHKS